MKTIAIGILGTNLDAGVSQERWNRWRPNVGICQHDDLLIDRFELLYEPRDKKLADVVLGDIGQVSPQTKANGHELVLRDAWDFEDVFAQLHQFARNYGFRTDDEEYLIHITTGTHVEQICLYLLAESRHLPGRLLQTSPSRKHHHGPGSYRIIDLDLSKYDALATRFNQEQREGLSFLKSGIETRNAAFNRLIESVERVAIASAAPLLITGPTGAGKSLLARRIYELKRKREQVRGEIIEVNCATLRGEQAMSALFGHVKGAFTGASNSRSGLLKAAHGGILFLDEIGELGLDEQAMLLRAIEEKTFLPVGSDKEIHSDFQLIAGTNRDLQVCVQAGRFREDLLARINLWTFCLPGLADRREDIAPNLDYELERFTSTTGRSVTMNKEARERFLKFAESREASWPANFRDLNAAVTRMATLAHSGRIGVGDVDEEVSRLQAVWSNDVCAPTSGIVEAVLAPDQIASLDLFDRMQLASVLQVCHDSKSLSDAGRKLFASSRRAKSNPNDADRLRKYLARFDIKFDDAIKRR